MTVPAHLPCSLCEYPVPVGVERCPECGLWHGSHRDIVSRRVLWQAALAFAALYALGLLIVALAR